MRLDLATIVKHCDERERGLPLNILLLAFGLHDND